MVPRIGDVILYPASGKSSLSSRIIAAGEILAGLGKGMEQYSHVAILDDYGYQYEAFFPFTRRSKIDLNRPREIWNLGNPTDSQRAQVMQWCKDHVGDLYNLTGVLTFDVVRLKNSYYCSQFAGLAYRSLGFKWVSLGDSILSPDSIPDFPGAVKVATLGG